MNAMESTHRSELLHCGCRVNPASGEVFTHCARHACMPVATHKEISTPVELPADPSGQGMKPLCPECFGQRVVADIGRARCLECEAEFDPVQIIGFGLSVDSKSKSCPECGALHVGYSDVCSHCQSHGGGL